ncbi:hypothetical protein ACFLZY_00070 [Patescibacteria group bacterium]
MEDVLQRMLNSHISNNNSIQPQRLFSRLVQGLYDWEPQRLFQAGLYKKAIDHVLKQHMIDLSVGIFVIFLAGSIIGSTPAQASLSLELELPDDQTVGLMVEAMLNERAEFGDLPVANQARSRHFITIPISAYNSEVGQTDDTPFITASQTRVRDGVVAANFLPFGTKVRIPDLFGDKIFVVEDRMNKRYYYKMDLWMEHKQDALDFGLKRATVEILYNYED